MIWGKKHVLEQLLSLLKHVLEQLLSLLKLRVFYVSIRVEKNNSQVVKIEFCRGRKLSNMFK